MDGIEVWFGLMSEICVMWVARVEPRKFNSCRSGLCRLIWVGWIAPGFLVWSALVWEALFQSGLDIGELIWGELIWGELNRFDLRMIGLCNDEYTNWIVFEEFVRYKIYKNIYIFIFIFANIKNNSITKIFLLWFRNILIYIYIYWYIFLYIYIYGYIYIFILKKYMLIYFWYIKIFIIFRFDIYILFLFWHYWYKWIFI